MDKRRFFSFIFLFIALFFYCTKLTFADLYSTFNYLPVLGQNIREGSIISASSKGYELSKKEYDADVVGIVQKKDVISFKGPTSNGMYQVAKGGSVLVQVSSQNGPIQKGDYITTSQISGIGMKATKSGYIISIALESYNSTRTEEIGMIKMAVNIRLEAQGQSINNNSFSLFNAQSSLIWIVVIGVCLIFIVFAYMIGKKKGLNNHSKNIPQNP